jgi:hypothetical protein
MKTTYVLCGTAYFGLCITALAQSSPKLDGSWFGSLTTPDGAHCWVSNRKSDGTYKTDFISQDGQIFRKYWQAGTWAATDTSFTTTVKEENGTPKLSESITYGIVSLTQDALVYRHINSGTRFSVKRVEPGFALPERCGKSDA